MNARILDGFLMVTSIGVAAAEAEDIAGNIVATKLIFEDSQLTGNVTCTVVGAVYSVCSQRHRAETESFLDHGLADPNTGCGGVAVANESGIDSGG